MLRYKSNKQAFIIAALVILLCLSCLSGATLALFTNDPNDGTIGIITTSGNVRVDIVDTTAEQNSLENKVLQFMTSSDRKELYFEPGATFYTQGFKVKNTGDIPIKFRLSVSEDEDIDMTEFLEAFEVWMVKGDPNSKDAERIEKVVGELGVGECSETYYLFIKMKENAGNSFQGKSYSGIGVTVYAVQGNFDLTE